jgi:hypothetical protein
MRLPHTLRNFVTTRSSSGWQALGDHQPDSKSGDAILDQIRQPPLGARLRVTKPRFQRNHAERPLGGENNHISGGIVIWQLILVRLPERNHP